MKVPEEFADYPSRIAGRSDWSRDEYAMVTLDLLKLFYHFLTVGIPLLQGNSSEHKGTTPQEVWIQISHRKQDSVAPLSSP